MNSVLIASPVKSAYRNLAEAVEKPRFDDGIEFRLSREVRAFVKL